MPNAPENKEVKHTNYVYPPVADFSYSRYEFVQKNSPCVFWTENDYPQRMPYENETTKDLSTTFRPDPTGGWFGPRQLAVPVALSQAQTYPWLIVLDTNSTDSGTLPKLDTKDTAEPVNSTGTGIAANVTLKYFANITYGEGNRFNVSGFQAVPFYEKYSDNYYAEDIDDKLREMIQQ